MSYLVEGAHSHSLAPGDVLLICPYDEGHKILRSRLKFHLERCRRNYLKAFLEKGIPTPMAVCQYSEFHKYPAIEIQCHERFCPQKIQKEVEESGTKETEYGSGTYSTADVDWSTHDSSKKEESVMDHVKKIFVPPVEIEFDAEEKAFWNAPDTRAVGRPTEMPPFCTGDQRVKFLHQRLSKAEKKAAERFDVEDYQRKLGVRKIQGKLHFVPKFKMDGKNMIDPEFGLYPVLEAPKESSDCGDGDESDTETVYDDACSTISGLEDLERDLEKLNLPEPARFGSMMSLATACSDFDDFKSCISFGGDED